MQRFTLTILALLLPCVPGNLLVGQGVPANSSKVIPLEVELIRSLNSETLQTGDEVLAKVRQDWTSATCKLAAASVIHGRVTSLTKAADGRDHVALDFRLRCLQEDEPQKLIWIALLAPEPVTDGNLVLRQSFHSSSFGRGNGLREDGNEPVGGSGKPGSGGGGAPAHLDMSGRQNPSFPIFVETEEDRKAKRPAAVKTGDVFQLPRLKLDVGAGPEDSTVLCSKEKRIKLPMSSILVLLPESAAIRTTVASTPAQKFISPRRVVLKPPPVIAPCAEPACTVLPSIMATGAAPTSPFKTISLDRLGYRRLNTAEMRNLDFSTAIAFLGDTHVLFTFDPHTLIGRDKNDRPEDHPHMVHAVLLNLASGKAERTLEWRVRSNAQYLWVVDGDHVVVHDGDRLRWFGAGLREEQEFKLDGPLAYLRMSPNRKHYAVGIIHELHTRDEHADLATADAAGPEEQVEIKVLDANLKMEDEGQASSRAATPVLLDSGRVELRRSHNDSYYLRKVSSTPGIEPRDFGRMESSCVPTMQSLSANLLMAEGCDRDPQDQNHWLAIFREDGTPILKSLVRWREFSPLTADHAEAGMFALAICEGNDEYVRASTFHGKDLHRETVRVHRVSDGHEIFAMHMRSPLPSNQPVSFSASGKHLAVVDGDQIDIYAIPLAEPILAQTLPN